MELLPSIDLRQGRVIRLLRGDDRRRTVYGETPREVLARYHEAGVRRVHVVDLDAALGEPPQHSLLGALAAESPVPLQLGGGLRSAGAVDWALSCGFERVAVGSLPSRDFALFSELADAYPGRLIAAVEVVGEELRIDGWRQAVSRPWRELAGALRSSPCAAALVTDIERDGALVGPNLELASEVGRLSALPVLLSGGIRSLEDLRAAAARPEIAGAVVGRALYEGRISLGEAVEACRRGSGR